LAVYQEAGKHSFHAAVITQIDKELLEVVMNDPIYRERSMKTGKFIDA
jgi:hypothetical protein